MNKEKLAQGLDEVFEEIKTSPTVGKESICPLMYKNVLSHFTTSDSSDVDEYIKTFSRSILEHEFSLISNGVARASKGARVVYNQKRIKAAVIIVACLRSIKIILCKLGNRAYPIPLKFKDIGSTDIIEWLQEYAKAVLEGLITLYMSSGTELKSSLSPYVTSCRETASEKFTQT